MTTSKRICLYDATTASDETMKSRYLGYFLKEISSVCQKIVCFVSEGMSAAAEKNLHQTSESTVIFPVSIHGEEIYREMFTRVGWEELEKWDEVVLTDWTMMGPVFPFEEMFSKMDQKEADFWGPCARRREPFEIKQNEAERREYIPFRFEVFRNHMIKSPEFRKFWTKNLQSLFNKQDYELLTAEDKRERIAWSFTEAMEKKGFKKDVYAQTPEDGEYTADYLLMDPVDAISRQRCPVFLRKSFTLSQMQYICESMGEQPWELFRYLKDETDFPVRFILEHLTRTCYQDDIARTLRMTYILPSRYTVSSGIRPRKIALIMHLYYMDLLDEAVHYAESMPEDADLYLFASSQKNAELIREAFSSLKNRIEIRIAENRGRDVSRLLVGAENIQDLYDVICFYHDKKTNHLKPHTVGHSFAYKLSECALSTRSYVENVLSLFEKNPEIGFLSGVTPNHGELLSRLGDEWGENYTVTRKLAEELEFHVPISEDHIPAFGQGNVFWYRTKALAPMFRKKWTYEDFPEEPVGVDGTILHAIERLYPFAVQEAGYLPGRIMPDHLASLEIDNLSFYVREYNKLRLNAKIYGDFQAVVENEKERLDPTVFTRAQAANLPTQIRLSLKKMMPKILYYGALKTKRLIFGPRDVGITEGEEDDVYRRTEKRRNTKI